MAIMACVSPKMACVSPEIRQTSTDTTATSTTTTSTSSSEPDTTTQQQQQQQQQQEQPSSSTSATATSSSADSQSSPLLRGFNRAITAVTVCHTGAGNYHLACGGGPGSSTTGGNAQGGGSGFIRISTGDLAKRADDEAQKVISMLSERMTVSKAIIEDVEVLSMLVERLFA